MLDKKLLQERFKKLAITFVKFADDLPDKGGFWTEKNQIIHSISAIKTSGMNHHKSLFIKSPNS